MNARRKEPVLALEATLWMTANGALLGGRNRIDLLRAIAATGSITHAAKAVGASYKAAWDAVDAMNNLAGVALVERSAGGRGGGRTALTEHGSRLLARYDEVDALHRRFVEHLSVGGADLTRELDLMRMLAMKTSARNHFVGQVSAIKKGAVNDEIEIALASGHVIVAIVTRESTEALGLEVGVRAFALVKASSILIATDLEPVRLSARNQLTGKVARVTDGAVNAEVVIALSNRDDAKASDAKGGAMTIAAIVTSASAKALGLRRGATAIAIFKASSVIVGVAQ